MPEIETITQAIHNAGLALEALAQDSLTHTNLVELTNSPTKLRGFMAAYVTFDGTFSNEQETLLCTTLAGQAKEVGDLLVKNTIMAATSANTYRAKADKEQETKSLAVLTKIEQLSARLALQETAQAKEAALEVIKNHEANGIDTNPWKSFFDRWGYSEKQLLEIVPLLEKL